ncbi:MAG: hypothetical protein M1457_07385, partial [bacterium]|nr:hypothetical protein [bacterium]
SAASLYETFVNPGSAYRGKPFWAWNGRLDPAELRRQVRVFERMGMGGAFLHSRVGLATPFLGKDWFDAIRAAVDESARLGMEAWIYDEDRWPSGSAGGLATQDPRHAMKYLTMRIVPAGGFVRPEGFLGAWQARLDGQVARDVQPWRENESGAPPPEEARLLVFAVEPMAPSTWYNGAAYLDTLSHEAVGHFIDVAYAPYIMETGGQFGKAIPGFFTDEPNFLPVEASMRRDLSRPCLPWTPELPRVFRRRYGYDLLEHLPELFIEVEGKPLPRARLHFRDCVTALFVDAFPRQIADWCAGQGLALTGHALLEEPLHAQTLCTGSAMRFYEPMQIPGVDILTEFSYEYDTVKQCASVAHQMGRRWMLSELYSRTGWDFPFEGYKALGDWQAALGVNLRCHHLSWYSMRGQAKRDRPASINFQSPWWGQWRVVEDYFARLNVLLAAGRPVRRLLVIHPIESMWLRQRPWINGLGSFDMHGDKHEDVRALDRMLTDLRDGLLQEHIDFDYGDEEMMSRLGAVRADGGAARLAVGQADYDAVLVPPLLTIRPSTLRLLEAFRQAGGKVVFAGEPPAAVDGAASDAARRLAGECERAPRERAAIVGAVEAAVRRVSIRTVGAGENSAATAGATGGGGATMDGEAPKVLYMLREVGADQVLFICNTDRTAPAGRLAIRVRKPDGAAGGGALQAARWNPADGGRKAIAATDEGDWTALGADLPASGSALFVIGPVVAEGLPAAASWLEARRTALGPIETIQLGEPNILVLDRPRYRIGEGDEQGPLEILRIDRAVREAAGLPQRADDMIQPWARPPASQGPAVDVALRYPFRIEALPPGPIDLVMEDPEHFEIRLNGAPVGHGVGDTGEGWWADPALRRVRLDAPLLRLGENELSLALRYDADANLETVFLSGDFGVRIEGAQAILVAPVRTLDFGDWTAQGLPFYGADVTYRFRVRVSAKAGEHCFLTAPDFKGALVRVRVGDHEAGCLAWPPYELDLTPWIGQGETELALQVYAGRRNCFGPLHQVNPKPQGILPWNYLTVGNDWREEYHLKPFGLMRAPELSWRAAGQPEE